MEQKEKDGKRFITPGGAGLAAICFFLPWLRACGQEFSGAQVASQGGSDLWLILIAALVVVVVFFMFDGQNKLSKVKPIAIIAAVLALGDMLLRFQKLKEIGAGVDDLRIGAWGTIIGFVASVIGVQFLEDEVPQVAPALATVQAAVSTEETLPADAWQCRCGTINEKTNGKCLSCQRVPGAIY
jgi:hypothetical protein